MELCKRLQTRHPSNEVLLNTLGIIYRRLGRYKEALFWTKKAISLKPYFWAAHNNLARTYHDKGDLEKCLSIYQKIINKVPNYLEARVNLAVTLKSVGDYHASLQEYFKNSGNKRNGFNTFSYIPYASLHGFL